MTTEDINGQIRRVTQHNDELRASLYDRLERHQRIFTLGREELEKLYRQLIEMEILLRELSERRLTPMVEFIRPPSTL